jgi:hypothetical protein
MRNLSDIKNRNHVDELIKKNSGFDYDGNFRKMLMQVIGLRNIERVERKVDAVKFQLFRAALTALRTSRNPVAHTYLKGTAYTLDAPSVTQARLPIVYDGLVAVEDAMAKLRL